MSRDEKHYVAFIASPSDCKTERKAAAAAVRRVDHLIGRHLGHRLEPVGWETDSFPDTRRPQDVINELLDQADIVIFLFWHRFGSDAGKGKTGTEEEFYRSLDRRNSSRTPRILLYFKTVDPAAPPSGFKKSQYSSLKRFRSELEKANSVFYGVFSRTRDWAPQLEEALADELFRRWKGKPAVEPDEPGLLLVQYARNLRAELEGLEILGDDPKKTAGLRTEIDRLQRLYRSRYGRDLPENGK